jgi:hypothetical protein
MARPFAERKATIFRGAKNGFFVGSRDLGVV